MPNRYVRESAIESESVNRLGWHAEVFYRRLINRVDDFGRFTAHAELLRASIFPLQLNKVNAADVVKLLLECEQAGLVSTWKGQEDGKQYLVLNKWERGRAKESRYPEPPADVCKCLHTFANVPDSDTDSDTDKREGANGSRPPPKKSGVTDEEWLKELASESHYSHVRVRDEYGKMLRWCEVNKRQPTRRRFVNWLNRIERPLQRGDRAPANRIAPKAQPEGWVKWRNDYYPSAKEKDYWRVPDDVKREFQESRKDRK